MSQDLLTEKVGLVREPRGALHEPLALVLGFLALLELLVQAQKGPGLFQQPAATLAARRQPAGIEGLDLPAGQLV